MSLSALRGRLGPSSGPIEPLRIHHFHLDAGEWTSVIYTLFSGAIVPLMAASDASPDTKKNFILLWFFFTVIYFWRKGKVITTIIDRKLVLSSGVAKREQMLLFLPFIAPLGDLFWLLGVHPSYGRAEWIILIGTMIVASLVVDNNFSFINDLLKAAPIGERGETLISK